MNRKEVVGLVVVLIAVLALVISILALTLHKPTPARHRLAGIVEWLGWAKGGKYAASLSLKEVGDREVNVFCKAGRGVLKVEFNTKPENALEVVYTGEKPIYKTEVLDDVYRVNVEHENGVLELRVNPSIKVKLNVYFKEGILKLVVPRGAKLTGLNVNAERCFATLECNGFLPNTTVKTGFCSGKLVFNVDGVKGFTILNVTASNCGVTVRVKASSNLEVGVKAKARKGRLVPEVKGLTEKVKTESEVEAYTQNFEKPGLNKVYVYLHVEEGAANLEVERG